MRRRLRLQLGGAGASRGCDDDWQLQGLRAFSLRHKPHGTSARLVKNMTTFHLPAACQSMWIAQVCLVRSQTRPNSSIVARVRDLGPSSGLVQVLDHGSAHEKQQTGEIKGYLSINASRVKIRSMGLQRTPASKV